ncbi:TetR/AcrR family transcriptional regulator [Acinetobacter bereziniae]|uniref:TetR/AcrR family transcriptional regulator n=1 Tax=Acinetobacter bereziniae TaxID=106648 RepID=UPI0019005F73|nr:TetR/AcrR family transcriptional regulator [Acinetobacter bereziniae]MBJ9904653.1 TetR/AcrR family transcriptional regulator [Acinetobacter bereziniae]MCU4319329.1 TetR/AcrR family transcriptional regulator [Acinetobacter bereziniae]MCU4599517.1 TetR/AcrR family transcriptional regulator [Acinetobacter bereziniae]
MNQDLAHIEASGCDFPQTKRGHERRLALLISANQLFLEHGYDAVSLDDIVNHAGGSKASIYKYFGNKEGLFTAICDYRRDLFFKDICRPFNPSCNDLRAYLITTLITFYKHMIMPDNIAFIRLIFERSQKDPQLALYIHEKGPKQVQLSIASALERYAENQKLVCENPLYSAQFYFGILRNLEWRILMGIEIKDSDQEILDCISYCVDRFLHGHQKV